MLVGEPGPGSAQAAPRVQEPPKAKGLVIAKAAAIAAPPPAPRDPVCLRGSVRNDVVSGLVDQAIAAESVEVMNRIITAIQTMPIQEKEHMDMSYRSDGPQL